LIYSDGRAIATAKVEVFDTAANLVKTLKTNATGKWTNALPPGKYVIQVSKKATSTNNAVEAQVEVTIPSSSEPVQLKPFQIS
jgi:predicted phage tail protein